MKEKLNGVIDKAMSFSAFSIPPSLPLLFAVPLNIQDIKNGESSHRSLRDLPRDWR
jgi:hypothetical protein